MNEDDEIKRLLQEKQRLNKLKRIKELKKEIADEKRHPLLKKLNKYFLG